MSADTSFAKAIFLREIGTILDAATNSEIFQWQGNQLRIQLA